MEGNMRKPKLTILRKCVYRYNINGELAGMEDVNDWRKEDITQLIQAIQKRGDGSWASMKELNIKTKRLRMKRIKEHLNDIEGQVSSDCLLGLTPAVMAKVFGIIDDIWDDKEYINENT